MPYFNNPRTEEELKEQFRKLLIKNDYRNPNNTKLISEIRKEYDEKLMQIKRANGYQTTFEKVTNTIKRESEAVNKARAAEKTRVEGLRNHRYTKEEYVKLMNNTKFYLRKVIELLVKENVCTTIIISHLNTLDDEAFYQWFNAQRYSITISDKQLQLEYNRAREALEYAIRSISTQTKTNVEKNLVAMEKTLGHYFKEYYHACCDEYLDPIELSEQEVNVNRSMNTRKKETRTNCIVLTWVVMSLISGFIISPILDPLVYYSDNAGIIVVAVCLGICILPSIVIGNAISKKVNKAKRKTSYATMVGKPRARVTERKNFEKNRLAFSFVRAFLKFLGF